MLRKTVGGQASESRHILGKAADVHFPDIPIRQLRYSALIHERGGVGYYPTSAIPFVHIDTDRVRAWPRLPRTELALLFPSGRTQHIPDDGEPISKEDVRFGTRQECGACRPDRPAARASRQSKTAAAGVAHTVIAAAIVAAAPDRAAGCARAAPGRVRPRTAGRALGRAAAVRTREPKGWRCGGGMRRLAQRRP